MLTVLDMEEVRVGGVHCWRLLVECDEGRYTHLLPAYTFEARAAELGITDPDELLEMVLLEPHLSEQEEVNPYTVAESTARQRKRAAINQARRSRPVAFANHADKGDMRAYLRSRMRVDPDNVDAFRHLVTKTRQARLDRLAELKNREMEAQAQGFTATATDGGDTAGALVAALDARARLARIAAGDAAEASARH
jgi:hypothetical protein